MQCVRFCQTGALLGIRPEANLAMDVAPIIHKSDTAAQNDEVTSKGAHLTCLCAPAKPSKNMLTESGASGLVVWSPVCHRTSIATAPFMIVSFCRIICTKLQALAARALASLSPACYLFLWNKGCSISTSQQSAGLGCRASVIMRYAWLSRHA